MRTVRVYAVTATRRAAIAGAAAAVGLGAAPAPARRVISLNSCLDVMLARLADRGQIAALSRYSANRYDSSLSETDRGYRFIQGTAEEIVALGPDLVLTDTFTPPSTRNALKRLGIRTARFDVPETVADSLAQVRQIADLVGHADRGRAETFRIQTALDAARPPAGQRPVRALVFQRGGFASGPGTLMDEMLRRTGFENAMGHYGYRRSSELPLERVVADPPELLLTGEPAPGLPGWGERVMRHPALAHVSRRMQVATLPAHLMYCGGPNLVRTASLLAGARRKVLGR